MKTTLALIFGGVVGFAVATFYYVQLHAPWVIVSITAAWVFKLLVQRFIFDPLLDAESGHFKAWVKNHPLSASFWFHGQQWSRGLHPTWSPRKCSICKEATI